MPTKTDRILSYLPSTFRALPRPTALYSVADAFGNELLLAENSLAAVMTAHWVDHADRGSEIIEDLGHLQDLGQPAIDERKHLSVGLAQLYGLQPRPDESVEEFREHLKRYVRTFLEGTVTVQGILRVTAEVLGLQIYDDYAQLDTWWTRKHDALVTVVPRGDDAARLLLGDVLLADGSANVRGQPARPAQIVGQTDLPGMVDLGSATVLRLKVDAAAAVDIHLPTQATLDQIKLAINAAAGTPVATSTGLRLTLTSPTLGPASRLAALDAEGDAAQLLLGLLPHTYHGAAATKAQVRSLELGSEVDLSEARYLRLLVDGKHLAEVDCADSADPAHTKLDHIKTAINEALDVEVASHDDRFLTLTSPTAGFQGSIAFQRTAAQDAKERLFGPISTFHAGRDAQPARVVGRNDLSRGVDLNTGSKIRVRVDDKPPVTVECVGADPGRTLPSEIVAALTSVLGVGAASHDGRFLTLASPTSGSASALTFDPLPVNEDAKEILFGVGSRTFQGAPATSARLTGKRDLSGGVNLEALHAIQIGLDGGALREVDVRSHAANRSAVTPKEIGDAINAALGAAVASDDGQHLILGSPNIGGASRIVIEPLEMVRRRRFATRAFVSDEAAQTVFGFSTGQARGEAATQARLTGNADLSRGVDLREARYLRLAVDERAFVDIDCAGPRPRVTVLQDVLKAINDKLGLTGEDGPKVASASADGLNLVLTSLSTGSAGRLALEEPRGALEILFGLQPGTFRGGDPTRVNFVGTVDLSAGIDLSGASKINLTVDGEQQEIDCANASDPVHTRLSDIVIAINLKFGKVVANQDGAHVILTSPSTGDSSRIEFAAPSGADATQTILGIKPPRNYQGARAAPAQVTGLKDLSGEIDLSASRFLRIAVNGGQPVEVDCGARAADPTHQSVKLVEIVQATSEALSAAGIPAAAKDDGKHLILESTNAGALARLDLLTRPDDDARMVLLGDEPEMTPGSDSVPAIIKGEADLLTPVNLAERRIIRLSVDGGRPVDVDVAGAEPATTVLDEIVTKINAVFPNLASATEDERLLLTSPTRDEQSRLELLPTRWLELIEYPPRPTADPAVDPSGDPSGDQPPRLVRHGDRWTINNEGVAESDLKIELTAPQGVAGPEFVNRTTGQRIRLMAVLAPGERAELGRDDAGRPNAFIIAADGTRHPVPSSQILTGSLNGGGPTVPLSLPRGQSQWSYLDCDGARFNQARFNAARFAGGGCLERAVFNISRFSPLPPELDATVFASAAADSNPPVEVRFHWRQHQPGAFIVNLPADLPEQFGGRFNQARLGSAGGAGEKYLGVVTEPPDDTDNLKKRINANSKLVVAEIAPRVELGFEAVPLPIRRPSQRKLSGGTETEPARLYLTEKDVPGFIKLSARRPGAVIDENDPASIDKAKAPGPQGNAITVTAGKASAARFDVTISFQGARFESARGTVRGGEQLPEHTEELLRPGPVGVLQAKAAGIQAEVWREGANRVG